MPEPDPQHPRARPTPPGAGLRGFYGGVLLADPQALRVRYVIDPVSGEPVVSCAPDAGENDDWRLFVPDEGEERLVLAGHPVALEASRDGVCDRWVAYHGTPETPRFFRLSVEWARQGGATFDAEEARAVNTLTAHESRVLRALRQDGVVRGVAVGVDELGLDVRVGHHVRRLAFPRRATDADEALALARVLLAEGRG
jgi:hypothetical protein